MFLLRRLLFGLVFSLFWRMFWGIFGGRLGLLLALSLGGLTAFTDIPSRIFAEVATARVPQDVYVASVSRIVDGDTFDVRPLSGWSPFARRLRIAGIDTPEKYGATACPRRAAAAAQALNQVLAASDYLVEVRIQERIGKRWLADARTLDGRSITSIMLTNGHARVYFPGASKTPWPNCF